MALRVIGKDGRGWNASLAEDRNGVIEWTVKVSVQCNAVHKTSDRQETRSRGLLQSQDHWINPDT
ncbi:hypothetical protein DL98DRAFT_218227 [Cadophora sp. DSE1049]|nr:hypothetical protein DL98DRAFT_218227 [Cadophora sp. DSE1049]